MILDDIFILLLDFYKAFDSLEHDFMMTALSKFGFGNYFCKSVKKLYTNRSIKPSSGTYPRLYTSSFWQHNYSIYRSNPVPNKVLLLPIRK